MLLAVQPMDLGKQKWPKMRLEVQCVDREEH